MKIRRQFVTNAALLLIPSFSFGAGLPPWQFGMTKDQVASFKQFGPYKSFSNGDLETYNGIFRGRKENVQFYFENRVFKFLEKDYGRVVVPEIHVAKGSAPVNAEIYGIAALGYSVATGRTEMTPVRQPGDKRVFARMMHPIAKPGNFTVAVFFDPH